MIETSGTLDLKIARLEQRLHLLKLQEMLSSIYPDYQERLAYEYHQTEEQLQQLLQYRREYFPGAMERSQERVTHEQIHGQQSLWASG